VNLPLTYRVSFSMELVRQPLASSFLTQLYGLISIYNYRDYYVFMCKGFVMHALHLIVLFHIIYINTWSI